MRINAITNVNYKMNTVRPNYSKKDDGRVVTTDVGFKGGKGAAVGTAAGIGYAVLMCAISGPLMPLTASLLCMTGGVGAIAGHNIEKTFKDDDKGDNK